jgi:hypothetical protein
VFVVVVGVVCDGEVLCGCVREGGVFLCVVDVLVSCPGC